VRYFAYSLYGANYIYIVVWEVELLLTQLVPYMAAVFEY
jgi:hypothetical protein